MGETMRILAVLVALLFASFPAGAQTWSTYTSEAGRYRVDMPGTPKLSAPLVEGQDGISLTNNQVWVAVGNVAYYTSYGDLPPSQIAGMTAAKTLEQVRDGPVDGDGGGHVGRKLLRDQPITIAGYPGREYVIALTTNYTLVVHSTLVGRRVYQVIYSAPGQTEPTSPDVRRFLDSFTPL
jgi:hypothetical protein